MTIPTLAEQVLTANRALRRETRLQAQRFRVERPRAGPPTRQVLLQALADGEARTLAEILDRAPGCHKGKVSSLLTYMVAAGRIERSGRRNGYRYRLA